MNWQTINAVGINILLLSALDGMQELETTVESLPVEIRNKGYSQLHLAAYFGHIEKIAQLITTNADVCARSINGSTPLHLAAEQGHVGAVEALVTELKKISTDTSIVDIQDTAGATPLACAAANGHIDCLTCLIEHGSSMWVADNRGRFPFHRATQNGHLKAMEILLPYERRLDDKRGAYVQFWLQATRDAVESGKIEVLDYVMQRIAGRCDPIKGYRIDSGAENVTPLLVAASYGHVPLMHWYLEQSGCEIGERDQHGDTALHYAARYGQAEAAEFLLQRDPTLIDREGIQEPAWLSGCTALHEAAEGGHSNVIEVLLRHNAKIDARTTPGATPLHRAAKKGHTRAVELLLQGGASPNAAMAESRTPLHEAAANGQRGCVEALLLNNADIEAKARYDRTPLLCAIEEGHLDVIKCLLSYGANIKHCSIFGNGLIHAFKSTAKNKSDVVHYLIHNTDIDLKSFSSDFFGIVPVLFAAIVADSKIVSMLINEGSCPLDTQLEDGRTVLHCAAHAVNMTMEYGIIRLLVRAGANMLSPSKSGRTPLDELQLLPEEASAAENYFRNRSLYLSGKLGPKDTTDSVFQVAAEFLDIPVLEALKDHLGDRLVQWRKGGKNLLMVAITTNDFDGVKWLLDRNICNITDVDAHKRDALSLAILGYESRIALGNMLLEAGATVTEDHLLRAAKGWNEYIVNEVLMWLLITYRYSQRPENERLSLFR